MEEIKGKEYANRAQKIAEELEENEETIEKICRAVEACGENADFVQICKWVEMEG